MSKDKNKVIKLGSHWKNDPELESREEFLESQIKRVVNIGGGVQHTSDIAQELQKILRCGVVSVDKRECVNEVLRHAKIIEGLCNGQDILSLSRQVQCLRATNEGIQLLGVILEGKNLDELAIALNDFFVCYKKYMDNYG